MPWLNAAQAREVTRTRVIMSASARQHIVVGSVIDAIDGDQDRQYSIRIDRQWRICFPWSEAGPEDVEIVDYH
jgi:plasmid maintenance system killer protein